MTLGRNHLPSRFLDATGSLIEAGERSLHADDVSILASGGLNMQALTEVMFGDRLIPWHWWLCAILATLVGNSFIALGLMIQKKSHRNEKKDHLEGQDKYFLSSGWLCGLGVFLLGHCCCWIGLALGAQTVLCCLNCWTMVLTCIFAPVMLGESLSLWKIFTTSMLVVGCALVVVHGSREHQILTHEKLLQDATGHSFLGLFTGSWLTAFFLTRLISDERQTRYAVVLKLCFFAALGGWYAVLTSKTISGLMFTSVYHKDNQIMCPEFWILAPLFLGFAGWNLHFLNMALAKGEALFVVPMYEAMSLLGQVVIGGFFFNEFHGMSMLRLFSFCLGVCFIVSGMVLAHVKGSQLIQESFV